MAIAFWVCQLSASSCVSRLLRPGLKGGSVLKGFNLLRAVKSADDQPMLVVCAIEPCLYVKHLRGAGVDPYHATAYPSIIGFGQQRLYGVAPGDFSGVNLATRSRLKLTMKQVQGVSNKTLDARGSRAPHDMTCFAILRGDSLPSIRP